MFYVGHLCLKPIYDHLCWPSVTDRSQRHSQHSMQDPLSNTEQRQRQNYGTDYFARLHYLRLYATIIWTSGEYDNYDWSLIID